MRIDDYISFANRSGRRVVEDPRASGIAASGEECAVLGRISDRNQADTVAARSRANRLKPGRNLDELNVRDVGPPGHRPPRRAQNVAPSLDLRPGRS